MLLPFFYHTVSDEDLPHCKHLFPVKTVKQFEADLEFLLKKYEPLMLDELPNWKQLKKPKFLLTFDDGMREVGEIIAPILLKKGVPAIFFVCKDFAQEKSIFHKHLISFFLEKQTKSLKDEKEVSGILKSFNHENIEELFAFFDKSKIDTNPLIISNLYLKETEIKTLSDKGFLIGSHSINHPHFSELSDERGHQQITESMDWIVQKFNPSIRTFAFPFEDYFLKKSFFEKIEKHQLFPEITFGTSEGKKDEIPYSIQRIDAEKDGLPIEKIIKNYQWKKSVRKLLGRNKIRR